MAEFLPGTCVFGFHLKPFGLVGVEVASFLEGGTHPLTAVIKFGRKALNGVGPEGC